jgi:hypothetical protein
VRRTGFPMALRFHDLGHSYASTLTAANLNPKVIQPRLGHATRGTMNAPAGGHRRGFRDCSDGTGTEPGRRLSAPLQVRSLEGVSRPVGRVLCARLRGPAVIHLGLPLPAASCGLPASIGRAALNRSRRPAPLAANTGPLDLAPGGVYRAAAVTCGAGGLLHHRFTLAVAVRKRTATAVCFLWHCPAGHPGSVLPTTLPCGARTFLTGPQSGATARPTHPLSHRIRRRAPRPGLSTA